MHLTLKYTISEIICSKKYFNALSRSGVIHKDLPLSPSRCSQLFDVLHCEAYGRVGWCLQWTAYWMSLWIAVHLFMDVHIDATSSGFGAPRLNGLFLSLRFSLWCLISLLCSNALDSYVGLFLHRVTQVVNFLFHLSLPQSHNFWGSDKLHASKSAAHTSTKHWAPYCKLAVKGFST